MRVFVLSTGRCGSLSFSKACEHITNFTSGHQTYTNDLAFPDNHIESSPPLHTCIEELVRLYPDARFVHLIRFEENCVPSLIRLDHGALMDGFRMLYHPICGSSLESAAKLYYRFVNSVIKCQLQLLVPQSQQMTTYMSHAESFWPEFWEWIGADGDYDASVSSWRFPVNTSKERGEL